MSKDSNKEFGLRLKEVREELNVDRKDFCEAIGISKNYISEIESGKKYPTKPILKCIECRFAINVDWLDTGKGEKFLEKEKKEEYKGLTSEDSEYFIRLAMIVRSSLEYMRDNQMPYNPETMTTIIIHSFYTAVTGKEMPKELRSEMEERFET